MGNEYYDNDTLKFEGDYLNEKIWNGYGYNIKSNLEYVIRIGKRYIKDYNYYANYYLLGNI